jgi:DNA-binding transcriptional ArsR family regulator
MLTALLDAHPRSAGELARIANVSVQSASMHLSQLLTGGFLNVTQQGRHRYFRIGSHHIAHAIEALGGFFRLQPTFKPSVNNPDLCYARTCYDHLAAELGVKLAMAMERNRLLIPCGDRDYEVTRRGWEFLARWHTKKRRNARRAFARRYLCTLAIRSQL